jgi:flagellar basal body-associated protein FliL
MDQDTQNQQPAAMNSEHKKIGPIISTLVIVLVLIIAALYIFASKVSQHANTDAMTDSAASSSQTVQPITNDSDDVQSIQADLNASTRGVDNQSF